MSGGGVSRSGNGTNPPADDLRLESDPSSTSHSSLPEGLREEHLSALIDHNPSLMFMKDAEGRYVYLNEAYEDGFVHSSDWYGKTDYDLWPKESAEAFRANDEEVQRSNQVHQFVEDSFDLEGNRHVWVNYKFPFTDSAGHRYTGGIGIDATQMVEAEEARALSDERFRAFVTTTEDAIYRMSPDWREMYSLDGQGFLANTENATRTWMDNYIDPDDRVFVSAAIQSAIDGKTLFELEHRVIRSDGTLGWTHSRAVPIFDACGEVVEWFGTARDITARRRMEDDLRRSEAEARDLVRYAPTGIYEIDFRTRRFVSVNDAMVALSGYSRDELLTMDAQSILTPDSQKLFARRVADAMAGLTPADEVEYRVRRKDGREIYVVLNVKFELDEKGAPTHALVIGHDVTERRANQALWFALAEVDSAIHSSLEIGEVATRALEQGAQVLDAQTASILGLDGDRWEVLYDHGFAPSVVGQRFTHEQNPHGLFAVTTAETIAIDDTSNDPRVNSDVMSDFGFGAVITAPLGVRGKTFGAIFFNYATPRHFTTSEREFVSRLASSVSLAMDNSMMYRRQRLIADELQEALLLMPDEVPGVEFAHAYRAALDAARVGGDFFDVFELGQDHAGVVIGDVAGKGLDAAVLTSLVKNTIRAHANEKGKTPAQILALTNEVVFRGTEDHSFATVFFGILDCRDGRLVYANAGHTTALLLHEDGELSRLSVTGPLLGALGGMDFGQAETVLEGDDLLLLYTDGLTEARSPDGEFYGDERLTALLGNAGGRPMGDVVDEVVADVVSFSDTRLRDDLAVLAVRCRVHEDHHPHQQKLPIA